MTMKITNETIEMIEVLAKLELTAEQKRQAVKEMGEMLAYMDKMKELDTKNIEPLSHVFSVRNVFREDVVTNTDNREKLLWNAPEKEDGMFVVPRTVE